MIRAIMEMALCQHFHLGTHDSLPLTLVRFAVISVGAELMRAPLYQYLPCPVTNTLLHPRHETRGIPWEQNAHARLTGELLSMRRHGDARGLTHDLRDDLETPWDDHNCLY